jgi:endonuclease YncB( thermonuclease family)
MLNAVLAAEGYAYSYTLSPKPAYADQFLALMREARSKGKGLWGKCQ